MHAPCWPDVWQTVIGNRWMALPAITLLVSGFLIWAPAPYLEKGWARILSKIIGYVLLSCVLVIVAIGILATFLWSRDPHPVRQAYPSPSGEHQAVLETQRGDAVVDDMDSVVVTKTGCCRHYEVFATGHSYPGETAVRWSDDHSLEIDYVEYYKDDAHCVAKAADVTITCTPHPPTKRH